MASKHGEKGVHASGAPRSWTKVSGKAGDDATSQIGARASRLSWTCELGRVRTHTVQCIRSRDVAVGGSRGWWPGLGRQLARGATCASRRQGPRGGEGDSRSITGGGSGSDGESERNRPHAARQRLVPTPGRSPNGDHTRKGQRPAARVKRRRQKATPVSLCARAAAARSEIWLASCSIGLSTSPVSTTYTPVIRRTF